MSRRPLTVGVTTLLALGAVATGASAQTSEIGVNALATNGSRQFFVEDLTGTALQQLDLGSTGQGQLFQTRVKDTDFKKQKGFTATAQMTNLYLTTEDGPDAGDARDIVYTAPEVPSSKIKVSYAASPTDLAAVSLATLPQLTIAGVLPTCGELPALLAGSPLINGLGGLTAALNPLCTALGGPLDLAGTAGKSVDGVLVPISERVLTPALTELAKLPINPAGTTETGTFDSPSFLGAGAGDPDKTSATATPRQLLAGNEQTLDLVALISSTVDSLPLYGAGGATTVTAIVSALQSSTTPATAAVGNALAGLSAADQTKVLNGLDAASGGQIATLTSALFDRMSGQYRSFPRLEADLSGAASGQYTGTMTVTFVQL